MSIPLMCDICQFWDAVLIRHRGKPESLCRCHDSADYRRYVNDYHSCSAHSLLRPVGPRTAKEPTHA